MLGALVLGIPALWLGQAFGLSRVMSRRGFHPLPWLAIGLLLGPAVWPLALLEATSGPPPPRLVRLGRPRPDGLDVLALYEGDELPEALGQELERLSPLCHRLVLGRVIQAGAPGYIEREAEASLERIASRLGAERAELTILYGDMRQAVESIREEGSFAVVLRSDHAGEVYDSDDKPHRARCLRDVRAA